MKRASTPILESPPAFVKAGRADFAELSQDGKICGKNKGNLAQIRAMRYTYNHNGVVFALSVIADAMPPLPKGEAIAVLGAGPANLQLFACQMGWLPLWGSWQAKRA